jgi:signal transduction histidine kinase/DNA-binding NarL/FixJ family response regulator
MSSSRSLVEFAAAERPAWLGYLVALVIVLAALGLRIWPLSTLGLRTPWITFYPAVMAAAVVGGVGAGVFAAVMSAGLIYFWSPTGEPFIKDPADWLGMAVFVVNSVLISLLAEGMRRAHVRATRAKEEAEAANRAKSVFLANMSHELRTPLNSILGFSRITRTDPDATPDQIENLDIVVKSGEHLLGLINNVLDLARIEAGHIAVEDTNVDVRELVHEVLSLMASQAALKGLVLQSDVPPDLRKEIRVDAGKVRRVLINLVGNAVKFTPAGKVVIRVREVRETQKGDEPIFRFEVEDSGIGIAPDHLEVIFAPFEQVMRNAELAAGTGLGLAISRQVVEFLGGHIEVRSTPGEGSVFSFEIATRPLLSQPPPGTQKTLSRVLGLAPGQLPARLLIAEDHAPNRLLLRKLLAPLRCEVREVPDGSEAVAVFQTWQPHLIWMDIRMAPMDGMEATRRIRASAGGADVKIVALTAHALEDERQEILESGCDALIRKPFEEAEIFQALEEHLGMRFRYSDGANPDDKGVGTALDLAALRTLSPDLAHQLHEAVILLDLPMTLRAAAMISDADPELGRTIRRAAEELRYPALLAELDALAESPR